MTAQTTACDPGCTHFERRYPTGTTSYPRHYDACPACHTPNLDHLSQYAGEHPDGYVLTQFTCSECGHRWIA